MELVKKSFAEIVGTAVLVLFGCGVAVVSGADSVAVALAFGLAIVAMAYSIGHISGCHLNPAVSLAMLIKKKITLKEFIVYVISQLVGAAIACLILMMAFGKDISFGANLIQGAVIEGHKDSRTVQYLAALVSEIILTFTFVLAVLGITSKKEQSHMAGFVIGLTLTLVHLLGLFITGTSVNPARSLMPALFALLTGTAPIIQVWVFIVGPLVGAVMAAFFHKALHCDEAVAVESAPVEEIKPAKAVAVKVVKTEKTTAKKAETKTVAKTTKPSASKTTTKTTRTKKN